MLDGGYWILDVIKHPASRIVITLFSEGKTTGGFLVDDAVATKVK